MVGFEIPIIESISLRWMYKLFINDISKINSGTMKAISNLF